MYLLKGLQEQLRQRVRQIYANSGAFAALLEDGSVVTWGQPDRGGNGHRQLSSSISNLKTVWLHVS